MREASSNLMGAAAQPGAMRSSSNPREENKMDVGRGGLEKSATQAVLPSNQSMASQPKASDAKKKNNFASSLKTEMQFVRDESKKS